MPLDWNAKGCVNGRTQYAQNGEVWSRILISSEQPVVSVSEFRPATGEYVADPLSAGQCDDGAGPGGAAGERARAPAAPTPRRGPSSPTSSATSPRCCRNCRTSGWSMPARTSGAGPAADAGLRMAAPA